jgi:Cu/Ag efflux pump CusA
MLTRIISFSINNKLIIGLFVLGLILYGAYETMRLPIDAVPDITNNQVQVITIAPSLGATDIERLVTFPVEQANSNISGMKETGGRTPAKGADADSARNWNARDGACYHRFGRDIPICGKAQSGL